MLPDILSSISTMGLLHWSASLHGFVRTGSPYQYKDRHSRYRDSPYKDETVMIPSYLFRGVYVLVRQHLYIETFTWLLVLLHSTPHWRNILLTWVLAPEFRLNKSTSFVSNLFIQPGLVMNAYPLLESIFVKACLAPKTSHQTMIIYHQVHHRQIAKLILNFEMKTFTYFTT